MILDQEYVFRYSNVIFCVIVVKENVFVGLYWCEGPKIQSET